MATLVVLGWAVAAATPAAAGPVEPTGGTRPAPVAEPPRTGGPPAPEPTVNSYGRPAPRAAQLACRTACAGSGAARAGAVVRVRGRRLRQVQEVVFLGGASQRDDASVAPLATRGRTLLARVPRTAVTGPVAAVLADGTRSPASPADLAVEPAPVDVPPGVVDAETQERKVFFGAPRRAELSYVVGGSEPATVTVELVRGADGATIARWSPGAVEPGVPQTVEWDGTSRGRVQRDGIYQFRVTATDPTGLRATSSHATAPAAVRGREGVLADAPGAFTFLRHRFPIAGAHDYGESGAGFGGGRGHQGHDVFAACGTPVVAARGGIVKFEEYHARAGHYLVIDGARTDVDHAYMHLREPAVVDEADRVKTGQFIGFVGATGQADGCHLHFEQWTAPGWYEGGAPFDPLPDLRAWDAYS